MYEGASTYTYTHKKSITNITINGENQNFLRVGARQGCPHLPLLFSIVLTIITIISILSWHWGGGYKSWEEKIKSVSSQMT